MDGEQKEVLRETLDKLDMSSEEINRFEKAFKDPKFQEMFEEYAKEISDPKARAESEAYLRQIESGNQAQNVYGPDVELVVPEENFVVKTRKGDDHTKVFINVCTSEKVEKAESKKSVQDGREGQTWSIPFSLGQERATKDKSGKDALVYDFVIHPSTCEKCSFLPFKDMVAKTALENIEKSKGHQLDAKSITFLVNKKYVGSEGMERPGVQAVKISQANKGTGPIKPLRTQPDPRLENNDDDDDEKKNDKAAGSRSAFSFNKAVVKEKKAGKEPTPKVEGEPGYVYESGQRVPYYSILEKGEYDILEMWGDMGKALQGTPKRPKELVLKVELTGIKSVRQMSLEVTKTEVILSVEKVYRLETRLPYEVFDQKGKAKFDKKKQTLEITIPVIPPPKPEHKTFTEPEREVAEEESEKDNLAEESEPEGKKNDLEEDKKETSELDGHPEQPAKAEEAIQNQNIETAGSQAETENERRWKSMHAAKAPPRAKEEVKEANDSNKGPVEAPQKAGDLLQIQDGLKKSGDSFAPSGTFCGRIPGYVFKKDTQGLGYYQDEKAAGGQGAAGQEHSKPVSEESTKTAEANDFVIKPSPSASLWDDID